MGFFAGTAFYLQREGENRLDNVDDAVVSAFETHDEYPKLLGGAHRRRVTPVSAPAAIRHLAFWNPQRAGPPETASGEQREADASDRSSAAAPEPGRSREELADDCIAAMYRSLLAKGIDEPGVFQDVSCASEVSVGDGNLIVLFEAVIDPGTGERLPCPGDIRPDSYRSIKISFRWHRISVTLSFELHTEFLGLTTVLDASEAKADDEIRHIEAGKDPVLSGFHSALTCLASVSNADEARCRDVHSELYHVIWDRFDVEVMASLANRWAHLGKRFVDFRGVVLGTKRTGDSADFSRPFSRTPAIRGTGLERPAQCTITDFDSLWNFITCALPSETEFTLSRFGDDRAFYATALGVQPDVVADSKHIPLYYLLFEDTLNPWQLGRMIYRVHRAGTARIAAIMHFDELRRATRILRNTETTLEKAIWRMSEFGDTERNPELRTSLRKDHAEIEAELAQISGLRLDGTLDARVERSRYYVNQFCRVTEALRIKRVSGFQPYDEFVTQRMGSVFEYIDSLGRVYARVQNDRAALQGRIQTLDSLHHEGLISEAQRIADIALSCALGPYYVAYIIAHGLNGLVPERAVWLSATIFGLTMFILIRIARRQENLPALLAGRLRRFALALLVAIPIASWLNSAVLPPPLHPASAEPPRATPPAAHPPNEAPLEDSAG